MAAVLSIPTRVLDKDIIPAFQVFDPDKRGLLEADEILKSLTNIGEKLDELEVNTFKENMSINEVGLFDYNGKWPKKPEHTRTDRLINNFSRIFPQIYSTTSNQNKEKRKEEEEEKINIDMKNTREILFFWKFVVFFAREREKKNQQMQKSY